MSKPSPWIFDVTEAEFEAWKLLLETMKDANAAQASNLGQVLAPAVASASGTANARSHFGETRPPASANAKISERLRELRIPAVRF